MAGRCLSGVGSRGGLDLDLGADLKAHRLHRGEHHGIPDESANQRARPYDALPRPSTEAPVFTSGDGWVHWAAPHAAIGALWRQRAIPRSCVPLCTTPV